MAIQLSDHDIAQLLNEEKVLPENYKSLIQVRPKRGHSERELAIKGNNGNDFKIILRQSIINPMDFSVILAHQPHNSNQLFRLLRCNGRSHEHTNILEQTKFYDFHIHKATERYQEIGAKEDWYAEATNRFADFQQAVLCLLQDGGFKMPKNSQGKLFEEI
jgi:hypothetical protein